MSSLRKASQELTCTKLLQLLVLHATNSIYLDFRAYVLNNSDTMVSMFPLLACD
jgi:hypothetical protein